MWKKDHQRPNKESYMDLKNIRKLLSILLVILIFMRLFIKEYQYSDDPTVGFALMKIPSVQQTITDQYYGKPLRDCVIGTFLSDENGVVGNGFFNIITSFYVIATVLLAYILIRKFSRKRKKHCSFHNI